MTYNIPSASNYIHHAIYESLNVDDDIIANKELITYTKNRVHELLFGDNNGIYKDMQFAEPVYSPDNDYEFPEYVKFKTDEDTFNKFNINDKNKPTDYAGDISKENPNIISNRPVDVTITMYDQESIMVNKENVYTITYRIDVLPKGTAIK